MKFFWALIVVLVVATGVLLAMRGNDQPSAAGTMATAGAPNAGTREMAPQQIEPAPEAADAVEQGVAAEPRGIPETDGADAADEGAEVVVEVGIPELPVDPATLEGEPAPLSDDTAVAGDAAESAAPEAADGSATADADAGETAAEVADAGNALMLNDRYRVTGEGTAESPYQIDFDMLVAVEQEYAPKEEGKKEIPEWINVLNGKHVNITGFVAFPFLSATANECMVMLNQWDGCCIGVPPTPYDAVEVQFAEPLDLNRGIPNYGTLSGVFRTDPYLVNGWLIGLYVMDDAKIIESGSKNQSGF
ncbi:MAG: hypothetical protein ACF8R9_09075 [Phycisphaerales bacterium JB054]